MARADVEGTGMRWARSHHPQGTGESKNVKFDFFFQEVTSLCIKGWLLTIFQIKKYAFPAFLGGGVIKGCFISYTEVVVVIPSV